MKVKKITQKQHDELIKETKKTIKNIIELAKKIGKGLLENEVGKNWITEEEAKQIILDLNI